MLNGDIYVCVIVIIISAITFGRVDIGFVSVLPPTHPPFLFDGAGTK